MPGGQVSARTPRLRRETRAGARTAEAESGRERAAQGRAREPTSPQNAEPARRLGFEGGAHDGDSAGDVGGADDAAARRQPPVAALNKWKKGKQAVRKRRAGGAIRSRNTGGTTGTDVGDAGGVQTRSRARRGGGGRREADAHPADAHHQLPRRHAEQPR